MDNRPKNHFRFGGSGFLTNNRGLVVLKFYFSVIFLEENTG